MSYRAVLFDLDGTLLDTLEDIADAMNRTLNAHGFPTHSLDAYRWFIGDGVANLITRALPEAARRPEVIEQCMATYRADYSQSWNTKTRVYPGIAAMLDGLTRQKLPLAILSNKPHEFTVRCVSQFLARWSFSVVLGASPRFPHKPDPAAALHIAHQLHIPPQDLLYLGDTATDMNTATAAGMVPVGVLWGFRPRQELVESGARLVIDNPVELLELLCK